MSKNPIRFTSITVDPALFGDQRTQYIGTYEGGWSLLIREETRSTVAEIAETADALAREHWVDKIFVDVTGLGAGILDYLMPRHGHRSYDVVAINPAKLKTVALVDA